jgi:organic hydroperoxide reductase OsmC/OhrA
MRIRVDATFENADEAEAEAAIRRGIERCPVADAVRRSVDVALELVPT